MTSQYAIEIKNISKHFADTIALDSIQISIKEGELFGLIGPDGAGKTTLFRILTTLLLPSSGVAHVCGLDVQEKMRDIRSIVGYMPGRFSLYEDLTIEENLAFFASVFGTSVQENYDLIKDIYVQIEPFKTRRAGALSGGMKQKLALCCALIHRPRVLFLDEPTTGVDAVSRREFWDMLDQLKTLGVAQQQVTSIVEEIYASKAQGE
jgi:ABC-type multidrug transport system ATPase subunit